jgi:PPOX class probable F420-dependent enzyme
MPPGPFVAELGAARGQVFANTSAMEQKMSDVEIAANFDSLAGAKSVLVTTFKRDGTPVPTPVCHVVENGIVYATTSEKASKVKRIRNNATVTIGACAMSGKPTGPTYAATARFVPDDEVAHSTKLKKSDYIGTVFTRSAHAHFSVRPMQIFDRLVHHEHYIALAFEPSPTVDLPVQ